MIIDGWNMDKESNSNDFNSSTNSPFVLRYNDFEFLSMPTEESNRKWFMPAFLHVFAKSSTAVLSILMKSSLLTLDGCPTPNVHMDTSCLSMYFS
jgi:hypothetical protein